MTDDLFSAGFAWDEPDVSQSAATPVATPAPAAAPSVKVTASHLSDDGVAGVAGVAETEGQRLERLLSQPYVAVTATPVATPKTADFCGVEAGDEPIVAGVASVANWQRGIDLLRGQRCPAGANPKEWRDTVAAASHLFRLWGSDLFEAGWSTLDVWGSEPDPAHRRVDRLGLVHFVIGAQVEAIDSESATILHSGKDRLTYTRRQKVPGAVPLWSVAVGESRVEGAKGCALTRLPLNSPDCQPASGESDGVEMRERT
ncbi:hypothetical protein [Sphingomonas sp. BK069]|uniref:hypothetical protein n=1 Tax=Sphingomonas sp. BK069 TaxID=2586979 RepID=UPI00161D5FDC|nr:hypothetical protein [Sphingomonas sp. BK069]MBB3347335.1 hypothetical protein [Sphingomonas sp. BK069]